MKTFIVFLLTLFLLGCDSLDRELDDGYQFGDISKAALSDVKHLRDAYCIEKDPAIKKVIIASIRLKLPGYPEEGMCSIKHDQ